MGTENEVERIRVRVGSDATDYSESLHLLPCRIPSMKEANISQFFKPEKIKV